VFNLATQTIKPLMRRLPIFKPNQDLRWWISQFSRRRSFPSKRIDSIKRKKETLRLERVKRELNSFNLVLISLGITSRIRLLIRSPTLFSKQASSLATNSFKFTPHPSTKCPQETKLKSATDQNLKVQSSFSWDQ